MHAPKPYSWRTILSGLALAALACASGAWAMETADCQGCHGDRESVGEALFIDAAHFDKTAHAELGCPACHSTVADTHPDDGIKPDKAACADCHAEVAGEYAGSSHGDNAACGDCHNPHAVAGPTEVSGYDMNRACAACHESQEVVDSHAKWLPQAGLHIDSLPCVTCHTGSQNYVITFYITDDAQGSGDFRPTGHEALAKLTGGKEIRTLVDANADDYISLAELRAFNLNQAYKPLRLQGMMTPEKVTHTFQTLDNRWDCSFCHASGPEAMQVSYLSFPQPDGTFARVAVEKGAALDTLFGTPDFYMMGATRSKALNIVGLAIIAGGMIMPVGHGSLRFLTRKNRKH